MKKITVVMPQTEYFKVGLKECTKKKDLDKKVNCSFENFFWAIGDLTKVSNGLDFLCKNK
jgi:hypothetical protein